MKNGRIHTGYYENWFDMSKEDTDAVLAERKRKGEKGTKAGGPSRNPQKRPHGKPNNGNRRASAANRKQAKLDVQNAVKTQVIAALKRERKEVSFEEPEEDEDDTGNKDNAGNSFGGRAGKKRAKGNRG